MIDVGLVPTPTIQLAVTYHHAGGGIAVTASHNPSEWNALKFIGGDGIFLDGAEGVRVRDWAASDGNEKGRGTGDGGRVTVDGGAIERHIDSVLALPAVDVEAIRKRGMRVALDTVRGAGGVIMPALLERLGCAVWGLELTPDGLFPRAPEPIPEHLSALGTAVRKSAAALGIAVDPDVDRLAIVDETGRPIGEDYTLAFAVRAVLGDPTGRRPVAADFLSAQPARRGVQSFHQPRRRRRGARLRRDGGADSRRGGARGTPHGGSRRGHRGRRERRRDLSDAARRPRRARGRGARADAAGAQRPQVSEIVAASPRYTIVKAKTPRGPALDAVYAALRKRFSDATVDTQDGLRLAWPDRWLHVRPSNTEPIVRLIAEAPAGGASAAAGG